VIFFSTLASRGVPSGGILSHYAGAMSFYESSGILAKASGDVIGSAAAFPRVGPGQPAERYAEVDPDLGRVRRSPRG